MKCHACSKPAKVHLTEIDGNGQKKVVHLCQECADKQQLFNQQDLNLQAILETMIGQQIGQLTDELARLTCPACGIKYMEFRAEGRLGCPHDYNAFRAGLEPLLQRIHRSLRHVGKSPRRAGGTSAEHAERVELRQRLRAAVEAENFEEAARLRDQLRTKEATDESG